MMCDFSPVASVLLYRPVMASGLLVKFTPPYTPPSHSSTSAIAYTHGVPSVTKPGATEPMVDHRIFTPTKVFTIFTALPSLKISFSSLVTPEPFWFTLEPFQSVGSTPGRWRMLEPSLLNASVLAHDAFQLSNP